MSGRQLKMLIDFSPDSDEFLIFFEIDILTGCKYAALRVVAFIRDMHALLGVVRGRNRHQPRSPRHRRSQHTSHFYRRHCFFNRIAAAPDFRHRLQHLGMRNRWW
jgi:hypothetical protein